VLGGASAHADPLAPLPVPLPTVDVPLLPAAGASPSPTPTATPSPSASPAPSAAAQVEPTAAAQQEQPAASTASAPEPAPEQIAASTSSASEPVAAAAAAPITTTSVPAGPQPLALDVSGALPTRAQWPSTAGGAPFVATPQRDAVALAAPSTAGTHIPGAAPVLSSGLLSLPDLAGLRAEHGLGVRPAPGGLQAPLIAPDLAGTGSSTSPVVVRANRVAQQQPAKPVGAVLFMMAAAAGAAAAARLRMVGWSRRA
jgi:hypothetical protein